MISVLIGKWNQGNSVDLDGFIGKNQSKLSGLNFYENLYAF